MNSNSFYETLGKKLRAFRKAKNLTLNQLSAALGKSIGTLSKYETGEIAIDLEVLTSLCSILNVDVASLLPLTKKAAPETVKNRYGLDFIDLLYVYWYKGSENKIHTSAIENDNVHLKSAFYFDVNNVKNIYDCNFIYTGKVVYSDTKIHFFLENITSPYDVLFLSIPSIYHESNYKLGLLAGVTFYYQSVAVKCLTSLSPVTDEAFLREKLIVRSDDLKLLRTTNFFTI